MILLLVLTSVLLVQSGRTVVPPVHTAVTVNLYVASTGNDSNPCTSASKCLTVTHALSTIPVLLDNNYVINVADGIYSESLDFTGFIGTGLTGTKATSLTILGDTITPANVVFNGTLTCQNITTVACLSGPASVTLSGLTLTATAHAQLWCLACNVTLTNFAATGAAVFSIVIQRGFVQLQNAVTASGFNTSLGTGMYLANGSAALQLSGTVTITGPGGAATTSLCLVEEFGSTFAQASGGTTMNLTVSGCQYGVLLSSESTFNNFDASGGTVSITNGSTTPANSFGVSATGNSSFQLAGSAPNPSLTVDHYTTCLSATTNGLVSQGPAATGPRTLTNCTATASSSGGTVLLF